MKGRLNNCIARYENRKDALKNLPKRTLEQELELELTNEFIRSLYKLKKE